FQAEAGIRDFHVTGVQTCALPISRFRAVFGPGPVTLANVARALATYQRTLISARAPYDAWKAGDSTALTPAQLRGQALFTGKARSEERRVGGGWRSERAAERGGDT